MESFDFPLYWTIIVLAGLWAELINMIYIISSHISKYEYQDETQSTANNQRAGVGTELTLFMWEMEMVTASLLFINF